MLALMKYLVNCITSQFVTEDDVREILAAFCEVEEELALLDEIDYGMEASDD